MNSLYNFSQYQLDFFDSLKHTDKNIVIRAVAGSGKTTTIVEGSKLLSKFESTIFLAFNKHIQQELSDRLPSNVVCKTLHGFGMQSLIKHYHIDFKVNEFKLLKFITELIKEKKEKKIDEKQKWSYVFTLKEMVDLVRLNCIDYSIEKNVTDLCSKYSLIPLLGEVEDLPKVMSMLNSYNSKLSRKNNQIDFIDMIEVPVSNNRIKVQQFHNVFIDECQDLNTLQLKLIDRLKAPKGRLIAVGDENQSIYGFAGSDLDSYKILVSKPNTLNLPLSISYRCAKNIVAKARTIYDTILPFEDNEDGEVRNGVFHEISNNDMVICRNVKPLIFLFFKLLKNKKLAVIRGKNIHRGILELYSKVKSCNDKEEASEVLGNILLEHKRKLTEKGVKNPLKHPSYIDLKEHILGLHIILEHCQDITEAEELIETMFKERNDVPQLMTIHKAKGLESDRVFLIERFENKNLIPSPYATLPWELTQENNLRYVAYTRAKKQLILLSL